MRNSTLDVYKIIACFLVIFIHSHVVCTGDVYWVAIARMAVPVFFMISGYYYSSIIQMGKERHYFNKIVRLTLTFTILYGLLGFRHLGSVIGLENLTNWLLFNDLPFGGHLWYLYALIYVLLIVRFVPQLIGSTKSAYISVILFVFNIILSYNMETLYYRNFLFTGLPYFLLGDFLNTKRVSVQRHSNTVYILGTLFLLLFLIAEYKFNMKYGFVTIKDHYVMLYPLCIVLFSFAIKNPNFNRNGKLSSCGKKYSTDIYLYHFIFVSFCQNVLMLLTCNGIVKSMQHNLLFPISVFLLTLGTSYILKNRVPVIEKIKRTFYF